MKKIALFSLLLFMPFSSDAGVCTLFGGYGCANGNYYGYNTHKAHQEAMKYHVPTGQNGYGISKGYPWYGKWDGYYPEYTTEAEYLRNTPSVVQPVFRSNGNFYAPPVLDYMIEIRPIETSPSSYLDNKITIENSRAQMGYSPKQMVRAGAMGRFECVNNLCSPVFTPAQLQSIAGKKRVFANPIEDGAVFESIYTIINDRYVNPVSVEELAISGLSSLYEGIGVRVNEADNSVSLTRNGIAIRTFENKPYKDDVKGWSDLTYKIIETLSHQSMKFGLQRHSDVFKNFFKGISVHLDGASKYIDPETMKPNKINNRNIDALVSSVKKKGYDNAYEERQDVSLSVNRKNQVVLTIRRFEPNTLSEVKTLLSPQLQGLHDKKTAGLIIDLRGNKGGLVGSAIDIADLFLKKGDIIALTKGRHKDSERIYEAVGEDMLKGAKIVVLVDENTASSAELLASALKENGRATVVGKKTFGKGTVQTSIALDDGAEISFTWAYIYTPDGNIIEGKGVLPDEPVSKSSFSILEIASKKFDNLEPAKAEKAPETVEVKNESYKEDKKEEKAPEVKSDDVKAVEDKKEGDVPSVPSVAKEDVKTEEAKEGIKVDDADKKVDEAVKEEDSKKQESNEQKVEDTEIVLDIMIDEAPVPDIKPEVVDESITNFNNLIKNSTPENSVSSDKDKLSTDTTEASKKEEYASPLSSLNKEDVSVKKEDKQNEPPLAVDKKTVDWFFSGDVKDEGKIEKKVEEKPEVKAQEKKEEKKEESLDDLPMLF